MPLSSPLTVWPLGYSGCDGTLMSGAQSGMGSKPGKPCVNAVVGRLQQQQRWRQQDSVLVSQQCFQKHSR
jgi:hypothetical protein